jgi:precorrin-6B methylase 2
MTEEQWTEDGSRADAEDPSEVLPAPIRYSGLSTVLRIDAGASVLQIGASDGALTAALASPGASVLALEADAESARSAGARSVHVDSARVVDATLAAWLEGDAAERRTFDVVVYTEPHPDIEVATASLDEVLEAADALLRPSGTLVVAARSPWGLSGMLRPASSEPGRAATVLARDLTRLGLGCQRWLLAYPDHRQPQVIVDTALFEEPEGRSIIKAAVREPVPPAGPGPYLASPLRAFGEAVDAGLAPAVADSYIVLAARQQRALGDISRGGSLWTVPAGDVAPAWQRPRELLDVAGRRLWHPLDTYRPQTSGPLFLESATIPVMTGRSGEDLVVEALTGDGARSPASLDVLRAWWDAASTAVATSEPRRRHLDLRPRHFIVSADGTWHYQAQDLRLRFALPSETLAFAALAETIGDAVLREGWLVGLTPEASVAEAARALLADIGVESDIAREYLWVETAADIIVRTSEGTGRDEARRIVEARLALRLDSRMSSIPLHEMLTAGARLPAMSARVAALELELEQARAEADAARRGSAERAREGGGGDTSSGSESLADQPEA